MHDLTLTPVTKQNLMEQFENFLNKTKFINNNLHFNTNLEPPALLNTPKIRLWFSTKAYVKLLLYIRDTPTEIAWHGLVNRTIHDGVPSYAVTDIMLYPQTVSGATVDTDQKNYQNWLINLDDNTANKLRLQGHSHVNMSASPSGVDLNFYNDILNTLTTNDFYIFMIMNKTGGEYFTIYDLATNKVYEPQDIIIEVADESDIAILNSIKTEKTANCTTCTYYTSRTCGEYTPPPEKDSDEDFLKDFWKDYDKNYGRNYSKQKINKKGK